MRNPRIQRSRSDNSHIRFNHLKNENSKRLNYLKKRMEIVV